MRLTAERVTHRFPGLPSQVLSDVSVVASAGRMLAITGPSGSGKSTLLSILGLLLVPDSGRITWNGLTLAVPKTVAMARTRLFGWVTQNTNVLGARSVVDNAAIALLGQGVDHAAARRRATSALSVVGLGDRVRAPARVLSGGEVQRLTVARVMLAAKPVVLADEPTGQLDRANTELVVATLRAAADRGAAIVIATHDPQVSASCDDRLDLVDGRVSWCG